MMTLDECIAAARLPIAVFYFVSMDVDDIDDTTTGWCLYNYEWGRFRRTAENATKHYVRRRTALLASQRLSEQQGEKCDDAV